MEWEKKGLIFCPDNTRSWMRTHAALPVAQRKTIGRYQIYFATRDGENRSRIGNIEVDLREPRRILQLSETPILDVGPLGAFDHNGVLPTCLVEFEARKYLYYYGWERGADVNKHFVGLAISDKAGGMFRKVSNAPILDRSDEDPYFCASPFVLVEGSRWRMWYSSAEKWEIIHGRPRPWCNIKYAESNNGITWQPTGIICVRARSEDEWARTRPTVFKENGVYKMFFSYSEANRGYRIGYAESSDGLVWTRMDDRAGIEVSPSGWDSEMICYPFVFEESGTKYMLYNGNGFGKTGFGYAVAQNGDE